MINNYVAIDLETTGLNPSMDRIIEIGMAKIIDGRITDTYSTLVNPMIPIKQIAVDLTGITDEMVAKSPKISDIIAAVIAFTEDMPIMGHNVICDFSFVKKAAVNNNLTFAKMGIDTLKMARRILPELEKKNLVNVCEHLGVNPGNSHRALDDALSSHYIYQKMYEICPEDRGFEKACQLNFAAKKDSPATVPQINYLNKLVAIHNLTLEMPVEIMSRSQASRTIDRIVAEYGKGL